MAKDLTVKALESLKPGAARREVPDGHTRGLFYVLQPTGAASWAYRYRFAGRPKKLTIGTYPAIDIKAARELASEAAKAVARGDDPAATKQSAKIAATGGGERNPRARRERRRHLYRTLCQTEHARLARNTAPFDEGSGFTMEGATPWRHWPRRRSRPA